MPTPPPCAVTYAKSAGLLVGAIKSIQPVLARAIDSMMELNRRDPSPMMLSAINEVAYASQQLTRAVADAAALETTERTRRELHIHAED